MRRRRPLLQTFFAFAILPWLIAPAAAGSPQPPASPPGQEVRTDAFSVRQLAADARTVAPGGGFAVSGLRLGSGEAEEVLDLERFQVFTDDARIVVHGDDGSEELPPPANAYFRGRVSGDPFSLAVLTVSASGRVRGLVQRGGDTFLLHPSEVVGAPPAGPGGGEGAPSAPLVSTAVEGLEGAEETGFTCDNSSLQQDLSGDALPAPLAAAATVGTDALTSTPYTARVAVETDWEFYQKFGNSSDAADYVGDLIAYTSTIYDAELDTDMQVSYLSLWSSSSDPWVEGVNCGLYEFGKYWNANRTGVARTIAHFMSGKSTNAGVAWVGVLCQGPFTVNLGSSCPSVGSLGAYGGDYGYTGGLDANFNPQSPAPVWDMVAVSHEIGHNFNSPHTHCYEGIGGSPTAVDQCYGSQTGSTCYGGSPSYPSGCPGGGQGCGTIMSYCHFLSPGLSNISLTLGEGHPYGNLPGRVPDRMRTHVEARAALAPACLARVNPCTENLALTSGTDNGAANYGVCGTITAGGSYKVGPSGDVTMTAGRVVLTDGFRVDSGGSLRIDA